MDFMHYQKHKAQKIYHKNRLILIIGSHDSSDYNTDTGDEDANPQDQLDILDMERVAAGDCMKVHYYIIRKKFPLKKF